MHRYIVWYVRLVAQAASKLGKEGAVARWFAKADDVM